MSCLTYQNIPQTVGCPCQTAFSWSGAPARPQDGPWERRPEEPGEEQSRDSQKLMKNIGAVSCIYFLLADGYVPA